MRAVIGICVSISLLGPSANADDHWYEEIAVHGFVSFAANVNFARPQAEDGESFARNRYRAFDFMANTFSLDGAELRVERLPQAPHDIGVRIDVAAGQTIPRVAGANGSSDGPFDLQQAVLYFVLAGGLRFDLGKFATPAGVEVVEGLDGKNDHYSHSFQFTFGPHTHTGAMVSYATPLVTAAALVTDGWDVLVDDNTALSAGALVRLTPVPALALQILYLGGKELPDPDPPFRHYLEVWLTLRALPTLTLRGELDLAVEGDARWYGGAGYLTFAPPGDYSLAVRAEVFGDPDGAKTAVAGGQTLSELTATGSYTFGSHHIARLELRFDHSSKEVFPTHDGVSASQITVAANYLGFF